MAKEKMRMIQSTKETNFWQEDEVTFDNAEEKNDMIMVRSQETYQTWLGFGGAVTESAAFNLSQISENNREEIVQAYYDSKKGLGYNLGRVHINSCDFSLGNYDYVDKNDVTLDSFSIEHEEKYVLPLMREIEAERGKPIDWMASPWSPPAWMKTNNDMNHGGELKSEFAAVWADYYVKYMQAMQEKGFPIWALSVQNEPAANQVWDSCLYTAEAERDFVKYHLGPALEKANLTDVKLLIWDHNRDVIVDRVETVLSDPDARKYVWGVGNHWYVSEEFENLSKVHDMFPDTHLLFTEGCIEGGVKLGKWHTGERYGRNIIGDMNNWLEGFIDWNIVLDEQGGPNHVENYCDAPVIVDIENDKVHYNSSYYVIGHFSKYIEVGAKRIDVKVSNSSVSTVGFINPDDSIVVVVLNETDDAMSFTMDIDGDGAIIDLPAHSITTYITEV